ncbi:hypothetical protein BASA61_004814 [Batrachochytrium salamandrivorans]|nr:hypothetical protein BASA61_004814 [Batrachochytrium salamandrivorans]
MPPLLGEDLLSTYAEQNVDLLRRFHHQLPIHEESGSSLDLPNTPRDAQAGPSSIDVGNKAVTTSPKQDIDPAPILAAWSPENMTSALPTMTERWVRTAPSATLTSPVDTRTLAHPQQTTMVASIVMATLLDYGSQATLAPTPLANSNVASASMSKNVKLIVIIGTLASISCAIVLAILVIYLVIWPLCCGKSGRTAPPSTSNAKSAVDGSYDKEGVYCPETRLSSQQTRSQDTIALKEHTLNCKKERQLPTGPELRSTRVRASEQTLEENSSRQDPILLKSVLHNPISQTRTAFYDATENIPANQSSDEGLDFVSYSINETMDASAYSMRTIPIDTGTVQPQHAYTAYPIENVVHINDDNEDDDASMSVLLTPPAPSVSDLHIHEDGFGTKYSQRIQALNTAGGPSHIGTTYSTRESGGGGGWTASSPVSMPPHPLKMLPTAAPSLSFLDISSVSLSVDTDETMSRFLLKRS